MDWNEILDLQRYPIENLEHGTAQSLLANCRAQLDTWGACEMEGFVRPLALNLLVQESAALEKGAYRNALVGNAYLDQGDGSLGSDHARNLTEKTVLGVVAYDEFPETSLLKRIYEWEPVMRFIGAILSLPQIHRYNDPMSALNLSVMIDGDYLRWHFDQSDFVTSLSIRNAEYGGEFEFVPRLRSDSDSNFDRVREILRGGRQGVVTLPNKPGSLVLFQGKYSLHRVTPIRGNTSRLMALLAYDSKPNNTGSDYLRQIRYGRTHTKQ
jgi:hypothetical protein